MAVEITGTLDFLLGRWTIARTVEDHRHLSRIEFLGEAAVLATATGASYVETGEVRTCGHRGPARRTLLLQPRAEGGVRLDFQDGRPFIDLDLRPGHAHAVHPCRADTYEMGFEVRSADEIVERWRVSGPEKDYSAETVWRRC